MNRNIDFESFSPNGNAGIGTINFFPGKRTENKKAAPAELNYK